MTERSALDCIDHENRWRIAARILATLPLAYNWVFRDTLGAAYPHLESVIFKEIARDALGQIEHFTSRPHTPAEVADALFSVSTILFGPSLQGKAISQSDEKITVEITACPLVETAESLKIEKDRAFTICNAYSRALVERLNPDFTIENRHAICLGEETCKFVIGRPGMI
jgi:predicted ArsR family transcriptional regulator